MIKLAAALCIASMLWISPASAAPHGLADFARQKHAKQGQQHYLFGWKTPRVIARAAKAIGLGRWLRQRTLVHVDNNTMAAAISATSSPEHVEVTIPAKTGHVFYRIGDRVYDFWDKGFRAQGVRPVGQSERYGVVLKLQKEQRAKLASYFEGLERSAGRELGRYDFQGIKGYHCVTFITRPEASLGQRPDEHLVKILGGKKRDGASMIGFANFLLRKAQNVEGIFVYRNGEVREGELDNARVQIINRAEMKEARQAFEAREK